MCIKVKLGTFFETQCSDWTSGRGTGLTGHTIGRRVVGQD